MNQLNKRQIETIMKVSFIGLVIIIIAILLTLNS